MRVKMLARMSGPRYQARPGDRISVDADTAMSLIAGGYATAIDPVIVPVVVDTSEVVQEATEDEPEEPDVVEDVPVELSALGIDSDVLEMLADAGLHTVADVEEFGDLTKIKGVGKVTAQSVYQAIAKGVNNGE